MQMSRFRRNKEWEGIVVHLDKNTDLSKAYRKLMQQVEDEGIHEIVKEKRFFEKPSDKKRRKRANAAYRRQKNGLKNGR